MAGAIARGGDGADAMEYGGFLGYSVSRDPGAKAKTNPRRVGIADKGLTLDVGNGAAMCFDEDTCRMAAGWTGGFLDVSRTHLASLKGWWDATPAGPLAFATGAGPGWDKSGSFADPRPVAIGPLPREWAHYKGLYRHGKQVVLSYSVGKVDVLELPGSVARDNRLAFTRTFRIERSEAPMRLYVCQGGPVAGARGNEGDRRANVHHSGSDVAVTIRSGDHLVGILPSSLPIGARLDESADGNVYLQLPPLPSATTFQILMIPCKEGELDKALATFSSEPAPPDLAALCKGGPSMWGAPVVTVGRVAPAGDKPYVVDTLTLPDENPWHAWMRPTGLDFFPDGRCAVCTLSGDVWIVSGIDSTLAKLSWKRFATGLYEPLGLKIVDGQIYVLGRDQITRLHDLDGDGEADFYENFNNDSPTYPAYHSFHLDLQTDSKGDFWYITCGNSVPSWVPMGGSVIRVSKDGSTSQVIATGLRAANGAGMGPHDEYVCADNQGNWTPVCRINWIKPGGFYGFNNTPQLATAQDIAREKKTYDVPLCWLPYENDNSSGGQVFITSDKWGPLAGRMLSTSYGKCRLFEVLWEESDGVMQGAGIPLPLSFDSGIMRPRFSPVDGQLYVCGLKGWQTSASRDGCLQRVRYAGKPVRLPSEFHVKKDGIALTFPCALDPKTANDEQSFGIEQYNYRWSSAYGSSKYKVSHPGEVGTDEVEIRSARLQPDGKTVLLEIPRLGPVMQMVIQVHIEAADGTPIECEVDATINHVQGNTSPAVLSAP